MDNLSGRIVKSYQITNQINRGGFGAVYRAFQPVIERDVALKVILPRFANEAEFIRRFEIEAQTVARLEHPYIVPLYDYWRDPDGAYLVMRLMRGGSLREVARKGALPIDRVSGYIEHIAAALGMAHRYNIVHRDIKPENILLDEEGNAYLTDFGIAQRNDIDEEDLDSMAGSVNYIAPELIRGERPQAASDIYSLGIMVFELLAGRMPFTAETTPAMLMHHLNTNLPDIQEFAPHLPDSVNQVLQRACSKDPGDRYPTVRDFARAFHDVTGQLSQATLTSTSEMFKLIDNPYKGLRAFNEADAQDFFGREYLVSKLIERLNEDTFAANFLAVVGPSGSGKSSVVRAGLIPKMRFGEVADTYNWFMADFVPGTDPIGNLENALLGLSATPLPGLNNRLISDKDALVWASSQILEDAPDARMLLFIDQFEEVFTLTEDESIRVQLLDMLTYAIQESSDILVIVTIRADFFDKPLFYEGFGDLIQSRTQVVLPLTSLEIEGAIVGPAENASLIVERELVAAIVADVREEPGALPLLQYALTELFERRETNRMTFNSYIDSGGVLSALARRAQDVYDDLSVSGRELTRQVFLRLVTLGEGTEDTRRRAKRAELLSIGETREDINKVLDSFGNYRLLTFDRDPTTREPTVEIAHEALIKRWDDLQHWLDESRNDVRLQRSLANAARDWLNNEQRPGYLLHGARLLQYEEWLAETSISIADGERRYLEASITEKESGEAREHARQVREAALRQRVLNRTRFLAIAMATGIIITIGLSIVAFNQSRVARSESVNAENARATSEVNARNAEERAREIQNFNLVNLARQSIQDGDSGLAVTLLQNVAISGSLAPAVQSIIYDVAYETQLGQRLTEHNDDVTALAINHDGTIIASGSEDLRIILWDAITGETIRELNGHRGIISGLAFNSDGTQLVSGGNDGQLILWDVAEGASLWTIQAHRNVITDLDYAPDDDFIVTASGDDTLAIWNAGTGEVVQVLEGHSDSVRSVAYSPGGGQIISASRDTTLILWEANTGQIIKSFSGHTGAVQSVDFANDGLHILSGSSDRSLIMWDTDTGNILSRFNGHSDDITDVVFAADDTMAVSTGCAERDLEQSCIRGEILLWDIASRHILQEFIGHNEFANVAIFTPDSQNIISGGCGIRRDGGCIGGEALIWDIFGATDIIQTLDEHESGVFSVDLNADGSRLLSGGGSALLDDQPQGDTSIILWDTETGNSLQRFTDHTGNVTELIFHPDGTQFISSSRDTTVRIWSLESNQQERVFEGHTETVYDIEFTSDAGRVLSAGEDRVLLWDYETLEILLTLENFGSQLSARTIAISPDDSMLAIGLNNGVISLRDAESGEEIRRFIGHTDDVLTVKFSDDGTRLLSGANDSVIRLWDVASGAEIALYTGHLAPVTDVSFSSDGVYILSASEDNTLHYRDIASGEIIRMFTGHVGAIIDVTIAGDGGIAYTASADGRVIAWRIAINAVIDWITDNRYSRELTEEEIETFRINLINE